MCSARRWLWPPGSNRDVPGSSQGCIGGCWGRGWAACCAGACCAPSGASRAPTRWRRGLGRGRRDRIAVRVARAAVADPGQQCGGADHRLAAARKLGKISPSGCESSAAAISESRCAVCSTTTWSPAHEPQHDRAAAARLDLAGEPPLSAVSAGAQAAGPLSCRCCGDRPSGTPLGASYPVRMLQLGCRIADPERERDRIVQARTPRTGRTDRSLRPMRGTDPAPPSPDWDAAPAPSPARRAAGQSAAIGPLDRHHLDLEAGQRAHNVLTTALVMRERRREQLLAGGILDQHVVLLRRPIDPRVIRILRSRQVTLGPLAAL